MKRDEHSARRAPPEPSSFPPDADVPSAEAARMLGLTLNSLRLYQSGYGPTPPPSFQGRPGHKRHHRWFRREDIREWLRERGRGHDHV